MQHKVVRFGLRLLNKYGSCHPKIFTLLAIVASLPAPEMKALDLVSVPNASFSPPASGGGDSYNQVMSADGRYILFRSTANNLARNSNGAPYIPPVPLKLNTFLRDRLQGTTTLISADPTDTKSGEDDSIPSGVSTNGQYVLFETAARVSPDRNPTNRLGTSEVYLRDVINRTTTLVSVRTNSQFNFSSRDSVMTPDARYVAFSSADKTFLPNDTNNIYDVFVRDMAQGVTRIASGGISNRSISTVPVITPDGRYVAFLASLVTANPTQDVYVCDFSTTNTFCVSTNSHHFFSGIPSCSSQLISQDGKYVAYEVYPLFGATTSFIFRHNLQTGNDDLVTSNAIPAVMTQPFDMSPDGRFIAFVGKFSTNGTAVYLWDGQTGTTNVVSTYGALPPPVTPLPPFTTTCESPTVDATGRFVAFMAAGPYMATNADTGTLHIYRRDMQASYPELVDVDTNGYGINRTFNSDYTMSVDGRFIAFDSSDSGLIAQDNNNASDVFVRDLTAETTELISSHDSGLPGQTLGRTSRNVSLSADGRYAAFCYTGPGIVAGYTNRFCGVFVRDLLSQSNVLVSVDTNGLGGADNASTEAVISGNGRYVAFTSLADNLAADDTNRGTDVFLRDLQAGTTKNLSAAFALFNPTTPSSYNPLISSDGRFVQFFTGSAVVYKDLTPGPDMILGTNGTAAAMTPDGRYIAYCASGVGTAQSLFVWDTQNKLKVFTNSMNGISRIAISTNGQWIAAISGNIIRIFDRLNNTNRALTTGVSGPNARPGMHFSGDGSDFVYAMKQAPIFIRNVVYIYNWQANSNFLVSRSSYSLTNAASGFSDNPDISSDGRYVVYESDAPDILPSDINSLRDVFLYDRQAGMTTLLSASTNGGTANYRSMTPIFTGDGMMIGFRSWASDLVETDFNGQEADLFALRIYSTNSVGGTITPPPVFSGQIIYTGAAPGQNPRLTWQANPGTAYQVQYKDNLTDANWLPVNASVVVEGGVGSTVDPVPNPDHRFYRIVAF